MNALDGWCWDTGISTACPGLFCLDADCTRIHNSALPLNWASGYPAMDQDGTIGTLKYMAYDAALKGWINVNGTTALDGVACVSDDVRSTSKKKSSFPWWAILIIVLGCVVVIAVVLTVVLCCCCKKKKRDDDDDDEGSFSSRGSTYTGSTATTGSSSVSSSSRGSSSRGSSSTGTSRSSGSTWSASTCGSTSQSSS